MQINPANYPLVCMNCQGAARMEIMSDEVNGVEHFIFCVTPRCINYDAIHLRRKREQAEAAVRDSKPFRRHRKKLWRTEIAKRKQETARSRYVE